VEPIAPFNIFARLDTFVEKVNVSEGQNVKKGQLLLELNVKDASSQLANAKSRLLRAQEDFRAAKGGGRTDDAARVMETWRRLSATATGCSGITIHWFVCWPRARRRKTNWPPMNCPEQGASGSESGDGGEKEFERQVSLDTSREIGRAAGAERRGRS